MSKAMKATRRRENLSAYLFLTPALLFFAGFVIFPMGMCLVTSFFNYSMTDFSFIAFDNYVEMFSDPTFGKSLVNTIVIVVVSVPTVCLFSLWVASVIYKMNSFKTSFFRCVFYLPVVTGSVAVTVVWKWIFNNYYGLLNALCKTLGIITKNVNWLGDPAYALWCIIMILFTTSIGQPIVLYVSALGNVDHSLVEAAQVDGATNRQVFWKIKWPQIMPTTLYILIITTINSFQCFALIQLLTNGGPNYATSTIMYYIYYNAFKLNRYGYGSAMGVILAVIIALFSLAQFRLAKNDR
ncbi:MAG: acetylneuraminate ABC transporter permease [Clostridiales bacterium]|nr:acetylneuraminate ABC transporter permease [Clostridiales bacterium]